MIQQSITAQCPFAFSAFYVIHITGFPRPPPGRPPRCSDPYPPPGTRPRGLLSKPVRGVCLDRIPSGNDRLPPTNPTVRRRHRGSLRGPRTTTQDQGRRARQPAIDCRPITVFLTPRRTTRYVDTRSSSAIINVMDSHVFLKKTNFPAFPSRGHLRGVSLPPPASHYPSPTRPH